jgi:hypothetical protein
MKMGYARRQHHRHVEHPHDPLLLTRKRNLIGCLFAGSSKMGSAVKTEAYGVGLGICKPRCWSIMEQKVKMGKDWSIIRRPRKD